MKAVCRVNNRKMRAIRKDIMYEAIMTDLYLLGAFDKSTVEKLLGHTVSEHLSLPSEIQNESDDE
jgi:hypothetical protein